MSTLSTWRLRRGAALAAAAGAVIASIGLGSPVAAAEPPLQPPGFGAGQQLCSGTSPIVCTYPNLHPGHYNVTAVLGSEAGDASTAVYAESRRLLSEEVATVAGAFETQSFTVNVREPEGQQNSFNGTGTPGLTLTFTGSAPALAGLLVTPAPRPQKLVLLGDSTVTDQETWPYAGWGQRLPAHFTRGLSVVNHSGSGESTVSMLAKAEMFAAVEPQLAHGDVALIQLAHNDKETTAEQYRANLAEMVTRIRARGATPVLVTPIVRHRFSGATLNSTGLIVTARADLPAEMRAVAAELGVDLIDLTDRSRVLVESLGPVDSEPIYLNRINGDRTHTSEYGATVYAGIVAGELRGLALIDDAHWR